MPPYRRSYKPKRKAPLRRRRLNAYKGKRMGQISRTIPNVTHVFKRMTGVVNISNDGSKAPSITTTCNGWQITGQQPSTFGTTSQFGLSCNFQLRDVIAPQDFTNLFDRYKLVGVKLKFLYQMAQGYDQVNPTGAFPPHAQPLPIVDYTFDGDDSNLPASQTEVQQHGFAKTQILMAGKTFKSYWTPRIDKGVYNAGGVTPAYTSERSCWIDCNSNAVEHYGGKFWITSWPYDTTLAGTVQPVWGSLTIQPIYYVALKDSQ